MRTGPTGVILSTLNEGRETAKVVVKDLNEGATIRMFKFVTNLFSFCTTAA